MKLLIRWVITSFSLFVAAWLVPGIRVAGQGWTIFAGMAIIVGLVNATVRPLLKLLSCPLIILTLGFFALVINGLALWFASAIAVNCLHFGFYVDVFWAAFFGALIVSIVSMSLTAVVRGRNERVRLACLIQPRHFADSSTVLSVLPARSVARALVIAALVHMPGLAGEKSGEPITLRDGLAFVTATINGRGPFRLLIDTGSGSCMLTPEAARKAGLVYDHRVVLTTFDGEKTIMAASRLTRADWAE